MRLIVVLVALSILIGVGFLLAVLSTGMKFILAGVTILIVGGFISQGLVKIPADPPHVGVMTFLGARTSTILKEGWHFLPIYPWVFGFVLVPITKVNQDLPIEKVRTPDRAESSVQVSLTWAPDTSTPGSLIDFLNNGGRDGVADILDDVVRERVREWAYSPNEGPQTWQDLVGAQREATAVLIERICGMPSPSEDRTQLVKDLSTGNGDLRVRYLGIILTRVNVGEIMPTGHVGEAADLQAKEDLERKAETLELTHISDRLKELMSLPPEGRGLTKQEAIDLIQSERGKVTRSVTEQRFSVASESQEMLTGIAHIVADAFSKKRGE